MLAECDFTQSSGSPHWLQKWNEDFITRAQEGQVFNGKNSFGKLLRGVAEAGTSTTFPVIYHDRPAMFDGFVPGLPAYFFRGDSATTHLIGPTSAPVAGL